MLVVEPRTGHGRDEELRSVGVFSCKKNNNEAQTKEEIEKKIICALKGEVVDGKPREHYHNYIY